MLIGCCSGTEGGRNETVKSDCLDAGSACYNVLFSQFGEARNVERTRCWQTDIITIRTPLESDIGGKYDGDSIYKDKDMTRL